MELHRWDKASRICWEEVLRFDGQITYASR
jgi:hypothetical protein